MAYAASPTPRILAAARADHASSPGSQMRAPAHREHRFQRIVNANSGNVNTDSSAS